MPPAGSCSGWLGSSEGKRENAQRCPLHYCNRAATITGSAFGPSKPGV